MRIEISRKDKKPIKLILPTRLIFTPIGLSVLASNTGNFIKLDGADIPTIKAKDFAVLMKAIKTCKRDNPDWYLLEAESDGNIVKVKL